ncbi:hypothetical protein D3C86_1987550 [compost metagenome]
MRPAKISTPITLIAKASAEEARKMLTIDAMMTPNRPMIRNEPMPDRSFFVV